MVQLKIALPVVGGGAGEAGEGEDAGGGDGDVGGGT